MEDARAELLSYISDTYKDVNGFRPRNIDPDSTIEELQSMADHLTAMSILQMEEDERRQEEAINDFECRISETIELGAGDRETALRWIAQAEGAERDPEELLYVLNLPYRYEAEVKRAL